MIGRAVALARFWVDGGLTITSELLEILRSVALESDRGARILLAANVLKGNTTAYKVDIRDGAIVVYGGRAMFDSCTVTRTVWDVTPE